MAGAQKDEDIDEEESDGPDPLAQISAIKERESIEESKEPV